MTNLVVPYEEMERLIELILDRFRFQTGIRLVREDLEQTFIAPREGMKLGIQLKNIHTNQNHFFCARIYIDFYEFLPNIGEFRKEEFQGGSLGLGDEAFVSIALLPRALFPTLSKIENPSSNPGEPTEITITVADAVVSYQTQVGFIPQVYNVGVASDVYLSTHLSSVPETTTMVNYATQNGTAIAGTDYKAVNGTVTWDINEGNDQKVRVPLLGTRGYFNWFTNRSDSNTSDTFDKTVVISDQNRRIYSGDGLDNGEPAYTDQWLALASQYLRDEPRYYEFMVTDPGATFSIALQMNYYLNLVYQETPDFSVSTDYLKIQIKFDGNPAEPFIDVTNGSMDDNTSVHFDEPFTDADFPIRLHFLFDPTLGAKVGFEGQWVNLNDGTTSTNPDSVPWYNFTKHEFINDRKFNFFFSGTKEPRIPA